MSSLVARLQSGTPFLLFPRRAGIAVTRATAALVTVGLAVALVSGASWLVPVFAADFMLRTVAGPLLSPVARLSMIVARAVSARSVTTGGVPKQLAAVVGAGMLIVASVLFGVGIAAVGWALVAAVALFAALEAAFGLCVVCRIYASIVPCPDCVGPHRAGGPAGPLTL